MTLSSQADPWGRDLWRTGALWTTTPPGSCDANRLLAVHQVVLEVGRLIGAHSVPRVVRIFDTPNGSFGTEKRILGP